MPQLAVPLSLLTHLQDSYWQQCQNGSPCAHTEATADLCNIAFYYLLRVGEYTPARTRGTRNTVPFAVKNVIFWRHNQIIPNTSPLCDLHQATSATVVIPRQKNGVKGQAIHHDCTGNQHSPVRSLARRVAHIMGNHGTPNSPIHTVHHPLYSRPRHVTANHINQVLKTAAEAIGLHHHGYQPSDVSSHSLRAGGAMALHLNGCDPTTIQKMGRWKSQTFLTYIHEQISAFSSGLSTKMSQAIPFTHIAGPRSITTTI